MELVLRSLFKVRSEGERKIESDMQDFAARSSFPW